MVSRREFCAAPAYVRALMKSKPNVLLLMSDQHRADWMGCSGTESIHTPNLDRLAREGVRFRNAYSSTPTCTPARAGLLTGMSPWKHGMLGYGEVARSYPVEMPRQFSGNGYFAMGIGKMHWTPQRNLHGFHTTLLDESGRVESADFRSDYRAWFASEAPHLNPDSAGIGWNDNTGKPYVLPERLHPTRWTADCAVRFVESYSRPEPWFLKVSFARPHSPYDSPQRWWDRYEEASLPRPVVGAWAAKFKPRNSQRDDIWHGDVGEALGRRARVGYSGSVSFVDEQIGRVLEALEKRRALDETFLIYLSDHGDMLGDHYLWRKSYAYPASSRIPFLVRGPGVSHGSVSEVPVEIRDVLPTLLTAAGIRVPEACDGQNALTARRQWIDLEHDVCYARENHWNSLTDGRWQYVYHAMDGSEQLFDGDRTVTDEQALKPWRARMTAHLEPRGEAWVQGGKLVPRPQSTLYSPSYPGKR